jgi:hypothetical protein
MQIFSELGENFYGGGKGVFQRRVWRVYLDKTEKVVYDILDRKPLLWGGEYVYRQR